MFAENEDELGLLGPEGITDPQPGSSAGEDQPGTQPPPEPGKDGAPGGDDPTKAVPFARFQEVHNELQALKPLAPIAAALAEDPGLLHDIRALVAQRRSGASMQPQPQPQPTAQPVNQEQVRQAWNEAFARDPVGTAIMAGQMAAKEEAEKRDEPMYGFAATLMTQGFKGQMRAEPHFSKVEPIFDQLLASIPPASFKGQGPAAIERTLKTTWYAALGLAYDQSYRKAVADGKLKPRAGANPPNYGGGAGGAGGAGSARPRTETAIPDDIKDLARRAGIDEKELAEAMESEPE